MRRLRSLLVLVAVVLATLTVPVPQAQAADGDRILEQHMTYTVGKDGYIDVTETFVWQFGGSDRHGIQRTYLTLQDWPDDPTKKRSFQIQELRVRQDDRMWPPFAIQVRGNTTAVRIGDEDVTVSGVHTYQLRYRIRGAVTQRGDTVQWRWNVRRDDQTPVDKLTVTVNGPDAPQSARCLLVVDGRDTSCGEQGSVTTEFQTTAVGPGQDVNLWFDWASSAFTKPKPHLVDAKKVPNSSVSSSGISNEVGPWMEVIQWLAVIGVAVWLVQQLRRDRRARRGQQFVGLPPGVVPPDDATEPAVEPVTPREVPVRFDPPDMYGQPMEPALAGAMWRGHAQPEDAWTVPLTMLVRRQAEIIRSPAGPLFGIPRPVPRQGLDPSTIAFLDAVGHGPAGPFPIGRIPGLQAFWETTRARLDGWLKIWSTTVPVVLSTRWARLTAFGMWLLLALTAVMASPTQGEGHELMSLLPPGGVVASMLLGLTLIVLILIALLRRRRVPSAHGTAHREQVDGFRRYLATAESSQLRFEEAAAIFSRYLPYATALGVADHWAGQFGAPVIERWRALHLAPDWYAAVEEQRRLEAEQARSPLSYLFGDAHVGRVSDVRADSPAEWAVPPGWSGGGSSFSGSGGSSATSARSPSSPSSPSTSNSSESSDSGSSSSSW